MQNAADAAALRGAFDLTVLPSGPGQALCDAVAIAEQNGVPGTGCLNSNIAVTFLNDAGAVVLPAQATTVSVTVAETHTTFFLDVLGIATSGTSASATAQVQIPTGLGGAPPIGLYNNQSGPARNCGGQPDPLIIHDSDGADGDNTQGDTGGNLTSDDNSPGTETWTATGINPSAVGQTYTLWGPQVCNPFKSNSWKGRLATPLPNPLTVGSTVGLGTGVAAGPTRNQIAGLPNPNIWVVPIGVPNRSSSEQIVGFAVFDTTGLVGANIAQGVLLGGGYVLNSGAGIPGFNPGSSGVFVIRLIK
jgi:hypothetical protein